MVHFTPTTPISQSARSPHVASAMSLPSPNPFPPGVVPGSPLTHPVRPWAISTPVRTQSAQPRAESEEFPGDSEFMEFISHVIEVPDPNNANADPTFAVLPTPTPGGVTEPTTQTVLPQTAAPQVSETEQLNTAQPDMAQTPEQWPDVTTAFLFDNVACPLTDVGKRYWITFNGSKAGIFDNRASLDIETLGIENASRHGPRSLADAFALWKHGCLTGLVSQHRSISAYSVLPRIVARPCIVVDDSEDESFQARITARNKVITDHFNKVKPKANSVAKTPSDNEDLAGKNAGGVTDHAMAVDPPSGNAGNIFQLAASAEVTEKQPGCVFGSKPNMLASLSAAKRPKRKEPSKFRISHSSAPSASSSGSMSASGSSTCAATEASSSSSMLDTRGPCGPTPAPSLQATPFSSPRSTETGLPSVTRPLWWVVLVGRKPGMYNTERTALEAFGDVPDGRLACYTTVLEASNAYADASSAGEVIKRQ